MTRVVVHMGLHKTGTTSFQLVCADHAGLLRRHGIAYPLDVKLTLGTSQHLGVVQTLQTAPTEEFDGFIGSLRVAAGNADTLLLSSEEFSSIFGDVQFADRADLFHAALLRHFSELRYVCVIRNDLDLLRSRMREHIEAVGVSFDGARTIRREVARFYESVGRIRAQLSAHLIVPRYEELAAKELVPDLVEAATGRRLVLPNRIAHATAAKSSALLLMAPVRMLLFNAYGEPSPYSSRVNKEYARIAAGVKVEPATARHLTEILDGWLNDVLAKQAPVAAGELERVFAGLPERIDAVTDAHV